MKVREGWLLVCASALVGALLATATTTRAQNRRAYRVEHVRGSPTGIGETGVLQAALSSKADKELVAVYRLTDGSTALVLRDE